MVEGGVSFKPLREKGAATHVGMRTSKVNLIVPRASIYDRVRARACVREPFRLTDQRIESGVLAGRKVSRASQGDELREPCM